MHLRTADLDALKVRPEGESQGRPESAQTRKTVRWLFVYDTLKQGFWNHQRFCALARSIESAEPRVDGPLPFPLPRALGSRHVLPDKVGPSGWTILQPDVRVVAQIRQNRV